MSRWELCGLVVAADVALPGATTAPPGRAADVVVELMGHRHVSGDIVPGRTLQAATWGDEMQYSTVELDGGDLLLRLHGLVDFVIDPDLRTVRAWTDPRCEPEMLGILVAGNMLATVLTLRGETVLHASAVEFGGRAVAFVAHSGMGKSTLATLACDQGARFVTDDLLRLCAVEGEPVRCWPGGAENRLRRPLGDLVAGPAVPTRASVDGRVVWAPPRTQEPCPVLAAIVLPSLDADQSHVEITAMAPGAAILELTRRPRLLGWSDPAGRARQFANLARLVRSVPVLEARVPWGPPFDPAVIEALLAVALSGRGTPTPAS
jgi:hypothetical protein